MTVFVGSLNPAKLRPVQLVFAQTFPELPVQGCPAASGVPDQPIGVEQTTRGAVQRAIAASQQPDARWGVGLEGGVRFDEAGAWLFGVVAVVRGPQLELARTAELRLPPQVAARVLAGEELGPVMDGLSGVHNIKQKAGTVGWLTDGLLSRADVWQQALSLSLAPFLHPELYRP
ncbi:inosine/xanthosine triphosphatase [Deinococcus sonorensis]|uniref:Probable inosine/xanthosine triphosphatase n=2 Tax=Deinococcus sonorensis TaxID=309891 RepID=A0AAU7U9V0_9DEIO